MPIEKGVVNRTLRPQLYTIPRFASERYQILQFQGEFSTQNYDNITELVKNFKHEKFSEAEEVFRSVLVDVARSDANPVSCNWGLRFADLIMC